MSSSKLPGLPSSSSSPMLALMYTSFSAVSMPSALRAPVYVRPHADQLRSVAAVVTCAEWSWTTSRLAAWLPLPHMPAWGACCWRAWRVSLKCTGTGLKFLVKAASCAGDTVNEDMEVWPRARLGSGDSGSSSTSNFLGFRRGASRSSRRTLHVLSWETWVRRPPVLASGRHSWARPRTSALGTVLSSHYGSISIDIYGFDGYIYRCKIWHL